MRAGFNVFDERNDSHRTYFGYSDEIEITLMEVIEDHDIALLRVSSLITLSAALLISAF